MPHSKGLKANEDALKQGCNTKHDKCLVNMDDSCQSENEKDDESLFQRKAYRPKYTNNFKGKPIDLNILIINTLFTVPAIL